MHSCDACFFRLCRCRVSKTCTQYIWLVGWFWFIILIAIIGLPYCRVSCTSYVYFMCICAFNPTARGAGSFDSTLWIITFTLGRLVLLPMFYHQIEPCCLLCLAGGLSARFHPILLYRNQSRRQKVIAGRQSAVPSTSNGYDSVGW